ncbi:flavoprotein (plasmid) [Phaeobacter sp. BS23]|uniref:flavoprotein n=1 Tax=Phaeobacter sp. BS23 TaxID=2907239 RepID=UPI003869FA8F
MTVTATGPAARPRILIGVTGSLDATMLPLYLRAIKNEIDCELTALFTPTATKFVNMDAIALFLDRVISGDNPKDWPTDKPGRIVADHDILAILPTTANTLSAIAHGSSQNRLTTVILAATFPVLLFPVMGGPMWEKLAVRRNVSQLREDGYEVFEPVWRENYDPLLKIQHGHHSLPDPEQVVQILQNRLPTAR